MKKLDLTILVPVYNEDKTLKSVLEELLHLPIKSYEVIIVDDGSVDSSSQIIKKFIRVNKSSKVIIKYYKHTYNRGKGATIKTALKHSDGEYFVIHDADLEYNPTDIPSLLDRAFYDNVPVVYGSRFLGEINNMPKVNYVANKFYNFMIRRLYPTTLTDMHTCYKMVDTGIIKELKMTAEGFDYATELVSKLLKQGYKIAEVPIRFDGRSRKEGKKINFKDGVMCFYKIISYRFKKIEIQEFLSKD